MVDVTQADREAADSIAEIIREEDAAVWHGAIEYVLTSHRTEAVKPLVEALEDIKLAAEEAAYACASCKTTCGPVMAVNEVHATASAALRSVQP